MLLQVNTHLCSDMRGFQLLRWGMTHMWGGQGRDLKNQCVSSSLSLHGGLSDMYQVSPQFTALQVRVRLESAKASLILKIEPTSRERAQLCLRTWCGWGGELLQLREWRPWELWDGGRTSDGAGTAFVWRYEVSRRWSNYRTAKGTDCRQFEGVLICHGKYP